MFGPEIIAAFFVTALLYSSVGFGGGSTYTALLVLSGMPLRLVPLVALAGNIIVVAIGARRFARSGAFSLARFWPLALLAMPFAWIGGSLALPGSLFTGLLAGALLVSGAAMILRPGTPTADTPDPPSRAIDMASGAGLGFVAGVTGIGGGIYLSPLLHMRRWGTARLIAGTCAMFILVNSLAGMAGQLTKADPSDLISLASSVWPLGLAVMAGGYLGSRTGALKLSERTLRIVSAVLILYVGCRLGLRVADEWAQSS